MNDSPFLTLLTDFAQGAGLPTPTVNPQGFVAIQADQAVVFLKSSEDGRRIELFAEVGRLGQSPDSGLLEDLLQANLAWQGTGGAVIGLDRRTRMVMLCDQHTLEGLTLPEFQRVLESFLRVLDRWTQELQNHVVPPAADIGSQVDPRWRI